MIETSGHTSRRERPALHTYAAQQASQPPAYSTISYNQETSMTVAAPAAAIGQSTNQHSGVNQSQRRHTTTHFPIAHNHAITTSKSEKTPSASACHTMPRMPLAQRPTDPSTTVQRILTAQDVAQLLRPSSNVLHSTASFQRNQDGRRNTMHMHHRSISSPNSSLTVAATAANDGILARSVDDLVTNAALVGESDAAASAAVFLAQTTTNGLHSDRS